MSTVHLYGNHRGGLAIVNALSDETIRPYDPKWYLADPKAGRSAQMAGKLKARFPTLRPQPYVMRAQDALSYSGDDDTVVLAIDDIADTAATLHARRPSQRVISQIMGRGPDAGTRIALQGTLTPGDQATESGSLLLHQTLGQMSRPASSRELTVPDPLSAAVLQPLRQVVSRQTARHLAEKEREPWDLSGGPLSVVFGQTLYPLLPVHGGAQEQYSQQTALALESAGGLPATYVSKRGLPGCMVVVALVLPDTRTIHFMRVALSRTGKRSVAGVTSFVAPVIPSQSAVFTD
jgi:hypothetical protein